MTDQYYYETRVSTFWIKPQPGSPGRLWLGIDDTALGSYASAMLAADDVYMHVTGWEEWDSLDGDKRFKLLDKKPSESELKVYAKIKPLSVEPYDLRTVPWEHTNFFNLLLARTNQSRLVKMLEAMYIVGGERIKHHSVHDGRLWLVDRIVQYSRLMGWDKLGQEVRMGLGVMGEEKPEKKKSKGKGKAKAKAPKSKVVRKRKRRVAVEA